MLPFFTRCLRCAYITLCFPNSQYILLNHTVIVDYIHKAYIIPRLPTLMTATLFVRVAPPVFSCPPPKNLEFPIFSLRLFVRIKGQPPLIGRCPTSDDRPPPLRLRLYKASSNKPSAVLVPLRKMRLSTRLSLRPNPESLPTGLFTLYAQAADCLCKPFNRVCRFIIF